MELGRFLKYNAMPFILLHIYSHCHCTRVIMNTMYYTMNSFNQVNDNDTDYNIQFLPVISSRIAILFSVASHELFFHLSYY